VPARIWADFPAGVPRPTGPINLQYGAAYDAAVAAKKAANQPLSRGFGLGPNGYDVHEIVPVKFGGSPTALSNKVGLPRGLHQQVSTWFGRLQRLIERG
jgi:filamentous hemagglutinin